MRRLSALVAAAGIALTGCGGGGASRPEADAATVNESTTIVVSTTTAGAGAVSSTLPATSTTVVGDGEDPAMAALELINDRWSTIQLWSDGWVRISTTASGAPVQSRDSEIGRLFPPEVHDALEAAGATDMVSAYEALGSAGLLDVALAVLREHPEAWDAVFAGPGTLRMVAETSTDGATWDEHPMPFLGPGDLLAADSDGRRLALVLGDRTEASDLVVATTDDLVEWQVDVIPEPISANPLWAVHGAQLAPVDDGWLLLAGADRAWRSGADGLEPVAVPTGRSCCLVEDTDAGVVAIAGIDGGEAEVWFSRDGRAWDPRAAPAGEPVAVAAVEGGVLLTAAVEPGRWEVWRADADPTDWDRVVLPDEIPWPVAFWDDHRRGVAQRIVPPGWGQRGYTGPQPSRYEFAVDNGAQRAEFEIDGDAGTVRVVVTDLAGGEVVYDRTGPGGAMSPPDFLVFDGLDATLLDDAGAVAVTLPGEELNQVAVDALDAARQSAIAGFTPARQAMEEGRYLLWSTDGVEWRSVVAPPPERDDEWLPWTFAAPVNGRRALVWVDDGELDLIELAG